MAQFYLLSVVCNILIGLILVYGLNLIESPDEKEIQGKKEIPGIIKNITELNNKTFRLVMSILSLFTGLMKILSVFRNDVPVIGDLLPALCGIAGGFSLILEYYLLSTKSTVSVKASTKKVFIDSRRYIGAACLLAGLLHFVFPGVMFL